MGSAEIKYFHLEQVEKNFTSAKLLLYMIMRMTSSLMAFPEKHSRLCFSNGDSGQNVQLNQQNNGGSTLKTGSMGWVFFV